MKLILLILIELVIYNLANQLPKCLNNWIQLENSCIHISEIKLNYEQSKEYCKIKFNATRLIIHDNNKEKLIKKLINFKNNSFWIGLNRVKLENNENVLLWDDELINYEKIKKEKYLLELTPWTLNLDKKIKEKNNNLSKVILGRTIINFDNRLRKNNIDEYFYLSSKQDNWKFSFNSKKKLFSICETNFLNTDLNKCEKDWQLINSYDQSKNRCIKFIKLDKESNFKQAQDFCKQHFSQNVIEKNFRKYSLLNLTLNSFEVDVLNVNSLDNLLFVINLANFEKNDLINYEWIIQIKNSSLTNELFKHKVLKNNSCFCLIPNDQMILKRFKRQNTKRNNLSIIKNSDKFYYNFSSKKFFLIKNELALKNLDDKDNFFNEDYLIFLNKTVDRNSLIKTRNILRNNFFEKKLKKKKRHLDSLVNFRQSSLYSESHLIQEFDCNALALYTICSYSYEKNSLKGTLNQKNNKKKFLKTQNQPFSLSLNKDDQTENLNETLFFKKNNYVLINFDLLTNSLLILILINLLLFIYLFKNDQTKKLKNKQKIESLNTSTHINFDLDEMNFI